MAIFKQKHNAQLLAKALSPAVRMLVDKGFDRIVNEAIEKAQKELADNIRNEFAARIQSELERTIDYSNASDNFKVSVDLRCRGLEI